MGDTRAMRAAAVLLGLLAVGLARGAEVVELDPSVDAVDQASEGALDKELASNKMLPEIKECPNSMWTEGFKCRQTEKKEDMVFSQKWSWGVYNEQFVLRLSDGPETWTSLSIGKNLGDTGVVTCYSSTEDIRNVFLLNKLNSPDLAKPTLLYPPSYEFPNVPAKLPVPAGGSLPVSLEAAETTAEKPKDPAAEAQKKST